MQYRKHLSALATAPLLAAAIAAPAATAQPIDPGAFHTAAAVQQDLRGEAATGGARAPIVRQSVVSAQDLRSEASADTARAPETAPGVPTWPVNPKPLTPVSQPVADGGGDGDIDWPLSVLALFGSLLLGGSLGVAGTRYRTARTHATG